MDTVIVLGIIIIILLIVLIVSQVIISTYGTEIKNFISRIRFSKKNKNNNIQFLISFFNDLASVLIKMSNDKIGALIVVENKDSLTPYINIGSKVDVQFFPEFVTSVFYNHKSALHDGAMIIRN
jgi:diadenylate cyclase